MKTITVLILLIFASITQAHEGHSSHGGGNPYKEFGIVIDGEQAINFSMNVVKKLVEKKKLNDTWITAKHVKSEQKVFKKDLEWIVSFKNEKAESSKQVIYIFLSLHGDFLGANFTGN